MRGIIGFVVLCSLALGLFSPSSAQQNEFDPIIRCVNAAETPYLRAEGLAERIGEIRLICTGGDPSQVRFLSLFILSNTAFTSDIVDPGTGETESLLLIDDPLPGVVNTSNGVTYLGQVRGKPSVLPGEVGGPGASGSGNVYPGFRAPAGINRIEWSGIPFRPAPNGLSRIIRLVNVRVDATQLQATANNPKTLIVSLATALPNMIPVGSSQLGAGFARTSYTATSRLEGSNYEIILTEEYPEAFRKRIANLGGGIDDFRQQGLVDNPFFTESGFTPDYEGLSRPNPGVADQGTRFVATFAGIRPGIYLTAPSRILSENPAGEPTELEVRRVIDFEPDFSGGILLDEDAPDQLAPVVDGVTSLVYEVVAKPPYLEMNGKNVIDTFRIPVRIVIAQPTDFGFPSVVVSYAPFNDTRTMSDSDPEPRFYSDSGGFSFPVMGGAIQQYVRMRYTPSDAVPVLDTFELPTGEAVSDSIMVIDGESWLSVAPDDTPVTEKILFAANPVGLSTGRYHGAVSMRLEGDGQPLVIVPVVLDVNPAPQIQVDATELFFRATAGAAAPPPRNVFVTGRNKNLQYDIGVSTATGGNWLAAAPASGQTPTRVAVTVNQMGLIPGRYEGVLSVRAAIASNSPQLIQVVLEVVPPQPVFSKLSIGNAASYEANGLSPGEIFMIFGSNLGPEIPAGLRLDENGRVATSTGGTRILIDGVPAPMILASKGQSGGVVPYNVAGKATVNVQIEIDGWKSEAVTVPVLPTKPGIFTADSSGTGQGAILNQDGTLNSPTNPAKIGSVVVAYLTGVGETDPPVFDGAINVGPNLPMPAASALFRIGGVEAVIEFLGGAPALVAGAIQANVRVTATPGEKVPFQATIGNRPSNTVYISIE